MGNYQTWAAHEQSPKSGTVANFGTPNANSYIPYQSISYFLHLLQEPPQNMGFPKIVVPQIIHFIAGFSIMNHPFLGITHSRKPPYSLSPVILDFSNRDFLRIKCKSIEQIKDLQKGYPQLPKDPGSIIDLKDGVCTERKQHSYGPTNSYFDGCIS